MSLKNTLFSFVLFGPILSLASPVVVQKDQFDVGKSWIWSYSEWDEANKEWMSPYLYEEYFLSERHKDRLTFEMSSSPELGKASSPHHKFVVDLDKCLKSGVSDQTFKRLSIEFYTKSFGQGWQLVSKKHKALAFTEKFNCYSGKGLFDQKQINLDSENIATFQWLDLSLDSWYSAESNELRSGVMIERQANQILVRMVASVD